MWLIYCSLILIPSLVTMGNFAGAWGCKLDHLQLFFFFLVIYLMTYVLQVCFRVVFSLLEILTSKTHTQPLLTALPGFLCGYFQDCEGKKKQPCNTNSRVWLYVRPVPYFEVSVLHIWKKKKKPKLELLNSSKMNQFLCKFWFFFCVLVVLNRLNNLWGKSHIFWNLFGMSCDLALSLSLDSLL